MSPNVPWGGRSPEVDGERHRHNDAQQCEEGQPRLQEARTAGNGKFQSKINISPDTSLGTPKIVRKVSSRRHGKRLSNSSRGTSRATVKWSVCVT